MMSFPKLFLLILLVIKTAHALIDTEVCKAASVPIPPPPPEIPNRYSVHVEWKEVLTNKTYTVKEFYDSAVGMGKMAIRSPFESDTDVIFNYKAGELYILTNGSCVTNQLVTYHHEGKQWLTPLSMIYTTIMQTKDAVYKGKTKVREYPAKLWETCTFQYPENITTKLDIFYSDMGWVFPDTPPNRLVPLQIRMYGKQHSVNVTRFNVTGDIIDFNLFPTFDEETFVTPPGVFCLGRAVIKDRPVLSETFSMVMELVDMDFHRVTFKQLWFDGKKQMVRYDTKMALGNDPDPQSTIMDFKTGHRYTTDSYTGSCHIEDIRAGDDFVRTDQQNKLYMLSAIQYFHLNTNPVQYIGQRRSRGIVCDVWVGVFYDVDAARNMTAEWYFTPNPWMEAVDVLMVSSDFVRMDIWTGTNPMIHNIVKYSPVSQRWADFDFGHCYPPRSKLHFVIYFEILDKANFHEVSQRYMNERLIEELTSQVYLEPNRLSNVRFDYDGGTELFLSADLVDQPPTVNGNMAVRIKTKQLAVTYSFMQGNVDGGMMLLLTNTIGHPIRIRSKRISQISYSAEFSTTTTHSTPSTPFRIPTLPHSTRTTEATPPTAPLNTPTGNKSPPLPTKSWLKASTASTKIATATSPGAVASPQTTTPIELNTKIAPCLNASSTLQTSNKADEQTSSKPGVVAAAVVGGLLLGAIVCLVALVAISRYRYIPWLNNRAQDAEMIPLGYY